MTDPIEVSGLDPYSTATAQNLTVLKEYKVNSQNNVSEKSIFLDWL